MSFQLEKEGVFIKSYRAITHAWVREISSAKWPKGKLYWEIHAENSPVRQEKLQYGVVPLGFVEALESLELQQQTKYRVDIVGPGYTSYGEFLVE